MYFQYAKTGHFTYICLNTEGTLIDKTGDKAGFNVYVPDFLNLHSFLRKCDYYT